MDFGFSKTQEESFANWGHDRVLYDAVLAVRKVRPQIIVATFVGGVTDGHGQHQVSGEIAQEAFKAAGDPKVFPDQLKDGFEPWQPLAVYSRDAVCAHHRAGHVRLRHRQVGAGEVSQLRDRRVDHRLRSPADVTIPVGTWDPALGRTYVQIAREGWGEQKSQYGGASPALSGPRIRSYHLWAVAPAAAQAKSGAGNASLFDNTQGEYRYQPGGLARLAGDAPPAWLTDGLRQIQTG